MSDELPDDLEIDLDAVLAHRAKELSVPHTVWTIMVDDGSLLLMGSDDEDVIGPLIFYTEDWALKTIVRNQKTNPDVSFHLMQISSSPENVLRYFLNEGVTTNSTRIYLHKGDGTVYDLLISFES